MALIQRLRAWHQAEEGVLARRGVASIISESVDGTSAVLDLEGTDTMGRVTVWPEGMCDVEVLSVESGDQLLWRHFDGLTEEDLIQAVELVVQHVDGAAENKPQ